ncbi:TPA: hypothetical protein ACIS27_004642, partial [Salmonella enterica subsp. enterica serovar Javiana]
HITCPFPAAKIRFLVETDLPVSLRRSAVRKHNMCHSVSGVFFYMLCSSLFIGPGSQGRKSALRLFRARGTLPENREYSKNRIT